MYLGTRIAFNCGKNEIVNFGDGRGFAMAIEREPAPIGRVGHSSTFCLFKKILERPSHHVASHHGELSIIWSIGLSARMIEK